MSKPKSRIRKEFHQISRDWSLQENSWKMEEPYQTTTSRRKAHFILCFVSEEVCRSLSKPSLERPSLLKLNHQTPSRMSKQRSRTRKESHQISRD